MDAATTHYNTACDSARSVPRVLLVDADTGNARAISALLTPEAQVTHAATLADAVRLLSGHRFALAMIDTTLPDGDTMSLLPLLGVTPVLVHARREPAWPGRSDAFLSKPWTSPRAIWTEVSRLLGVPTDMTAGELR